MLWVVAAVVALVIVVAVVSLVVVRKRARRTTLGPLAQRLQAETLGLADSEGGL